jgi:hypothetical protein
VDGAGEPVDPDAGVGCVQCGGGMTKTELEAWKTAVEHVVDELRSEAGDCSQNAPLFPPLMAAFLSERADKILRLCHVAYETLNDPR